MHFKFYRFFFGKLFQRISRLFLKDHSWFSRDFFSQFLIIAILVRMFHKYCIKIRILLQRLLYPIEQYLLELQKCFFASVLTALKTACNPYQFCFSHPEAKI